MMDTIFNSDVLGLSWNGPIQVACAGRSLEQLRTALTLVANGHASGLFGDAAFEVVANPAHDQQYLACHTKSVNGNIWALIGNMLCAHQKDKGTLLISKQDLRASIELIPRLYKPHVPLPSMTCELSECTDVMDNFVVQFEFYSALQAQERDRFCEGLSAWAKIVDAGAYPMEESLYLGSVMGGYSARFEDPSTGGFYGDGMAANPACFSLLINLANRWNGTYPIRSMRLEHMT